MFYTTNMKLKTEKKFKSTWNSNTYETPRGILLLKIVTEFSRSFMHYIYSCKHRTYNAKNKYQNVNWDLAENTHLSKNIYKWCSTRLLNREKNSRRFFYMSAQYSTKIINILCRGEFLRDFVCGKVWTRNMPMKRNCLENVASKEFSMYWSYRVWYCQWTLGNLYSVEKRFVWLWYMVATGDENIEWRENGRNV